MPFNPKAVKELREREGLSQIDLGDLLEVDNSTISYYESGNREPTLATLDRLYSIASKRGHKDLEFYAPNK